MKKILGIGNALVDVLIRLESDDTLVTYNLPKGSMQLVDDQKSNEVLEGAKNLAKQINSGGSAANTIDGLANLGAPCGYIGKIGKDEFGQIFQNQLQDRQIETKMGITDTQTGRAVALISNDAERTFATFLGAAIELSPDDLKEDDFKDYDYLYLEGYLVQNHALIEEAVKLAKKLSMKVVVDTDSYNVVETNVEFLNSIIEEYVDIVFANEEEARALTGKEPQEALEELASKCEIAVVKTGKKGSLVKSEGKVYEIEPITAESVDTTGAGDLYAAGFLYGLVRNLPFDKCGAIGSLVAGKVIEVIGARMDAARWKMINEEVSQLVSS
jgi:sugar/nucleoside kinase (ribokinase family)